MAQGETVKKNKNNPMEIWGEEKKFNFSDELKPLFEAMKAGNVIKSITCCGGEINRNNRDKDFKIENFVANVYMVGLGSNHNGEWHDCVNTDKGMFWMSWVLAFEL